MRNRLPSTRKGITHRAVIHTDGKRIKFFITVNCYENGTPAELFLTFDESGGAVDGWADVWSAAISVSLQHGEPLKNIIAKYSYVQFEPQGQTDNPDIRFCKSVPDYVVRFLALQFPPKNEKGPENGDLPASDPDSSLAT